MVWRLDECVKCFQTTNVSTKSPKNKRPRLSEAPDVISKSKSKPTLSETEAFADWSAPTLSNADVNSDNIVQDLSKHLPAENSNELTNSNNGNNNNTMNNNNNNTLDGNGHYIKRMDYGAFKLENFTNYVSETFPNTDETAVPTDLTQPGKLN